MRHVADANKINGWDLFLAFVVQSSIITSISDFKNLPVCFEPLCTDLNQPENSKTAGKRR